MKKTSAVHHKASQNSKKYSIHRFSVGTKSMENVDYSSLPLKMHYSPSNTKYSSSAYCTNEGGHNGHGPYLLDCDNGFATWVTEGISLTAGKWYYEFEVLGNGKADGCPQIGWADSAFRGDG